MKQSLFLKSLLLASFFLAACSKEAPQSIIIHPDTSNTLLATKSNLQPKNTLVSDEDLLNYLKFRSLESKDLAETKSVTPINDEI